MKRIETDLLIPGGGEPVRDGMAGRSGGWR
jgi:hypothetical protein